MIVKSVLQPLQRDDDVNSDYSCVVSTPMSGTLRFTINWN